MNIPSLQSIIPTHFSDDSKVWIYQSSRPFNEKESLEINEQLYQFYSQWLTHGSEVKGWAGLVYHQFIIIMADENEVAVSGCSADSSVRIIKSIERQYSVNMFDRLTLTFLVKDKAEMLPLNQVQYAANRGYITEDTLLFNNLVNTKKDLLHHWLQPIKDSWLKSKIKFDIENTTLQ